MKMFYNFLRHFLPRPSFMRHDPCLPLNGPLTRSHFSSLCCGFPFRAGQDIGGASGFRSPTPEPPGSRPGPASQPAGSGRGDGESSTSSGGARRREAISSGPASGGQQSPPACSPVQQHAGPPTHVPHRHQARRCLFGFNSHHLFIFCR